MSANLIPITSDGGFISGGNISFSNSTGSVFSTSSVNVQVGTDEINSYWAEAYGDFALDVNETPATAVVYDSSGYIISTVTADNGADTQGMIRKLSSSGTVVWSYSIPTGLSGVDYSSAESVETDSTGTIYLLSNLWGTPNNILVSKLDSSGNLVWNNRISGLADNPYDITCISDGRSFVVGDNNILTGLDANGAVSFSYTGAASYTVIDSGSDLLVSGANGYVRGFDYTGTALWENQVFAGNPDVFGVAWDGTDWYAVSTDGYITKVSGADNQTVIWEKSFTGVAGIFPMWVEYHSNYLYMAADSNNGTVVSKISPSTGSIVWARQITIDSSGMDQWYWYGHRDLTVGNNLLTICGYGGPNTGANAAKSIVITMSTDGDPVGVYSYYTIANLPELILDTLSNPGTGYAATPSYTTSTITENYDPISLVSPPAYTSELTSFSFIAPIWNFNLDGSVDLPDYPEISAQTKITLTANTSSWAFGNNGLLTFPDSTSMSSAPNWNTLLGKTGNQGPVNVVLGQYAGQNLGNRTGIVSLGYSAGGPSNYPAGTGTVSIGYYSAYNFGAGENSVSIGYQAAWSGAGEGAVAIGPSAASGNLLAASGARSIAIGNGSGNTFYGPIASEAIAIGSSAGASSDYSIALGKLAQVRDNADYSIAIGYEARVDSNHSNSIVINATGPFVYSAGTGTTVIKPVRNAISIGGSLLQYNAGTGEVTYSDQIDINTATIGVGGLTINGLLKLPVTESIPAITTSTGTVAVCDGIGWNGGGDGLQHLMIYINGTWTKVV
jgi:hypothetical protein